MGTEPLQHPIGFAPWEISTLVNKEVVSQHSEEAAFLWTLRDRAVTEPHYALKDIAALDERVEAHLDGLRVAGDVGWEFSKVNLANVGAGEVFTLTVLAFGTGNRERMRETLNAGSGDPKLRRGLVSGLGWLGFSGVSEWIRRLLEAKAPLHRAVGIAACAVHREDPGPSLTLALNDSDPLLRSRALRTTGEIKRHDLVDCVVAHLKDDDRACQFWAAWTAPLLGRREGVPILMRFVEEKTAYAERALQVALRAIGLPESRQWVSWLAHQSHLARFAIVGAGIVGDPVSIPWLIKKMESPDFARLAGEAFTMITGVDLAYHDLNQDPPGADTKEDDPEQVTPLDYESNLPWPSAALVAQWWEGNQHAFSGGTRYLGGTPITTQAAVEVLKNGKQRLRAAAALELALLNPNDALFDVRARGSWQEKRLAAWTS